MRAAAALFASLLVSGCHRPAPDRQPLDALDERLAGNGAGLDRSATMTTATTPPHRDAIDAASPNPADRATPLSPPPTSTPATDRGVAACSAALDHDRTWSSRLPTGIAVFPGATVREAAGNDGGGCRLRIVSFVTTAPAGRVADWYVGQARAAGYAVEDRITGARHMLGGDRRDGAFILYLDPWRRGGTAGDLIVQGGR